MFMFRRKFYFVLLMFGVVVLSTGCFGLFSSKSRTTPTPPSRIEGTLTGPKQLVLDTSQSTALQKNELYKAAHSFAALFSIRSAFAASITGETPLPHVPVAVYALTDYIEAPTTAQPIQSGVTDADGTFSFIGVPEHVDHIIVAATVPRMSSIVPRGGKNKTADVNSVTALVAEAWAPHLRANAQIVSATELATALGEARHILNDLQLDDGELFNMMNDIIPDLFGDGLPESPPPEFNGLIESLLRSAPGYESDTYSVAGWVEDQNGSRLAGIEITFSNGYSSVFTDQQGEWHRDNLEGDVVVSAVDVDGSFIVITPPMSVSEETMDIEIQGYAGTVRDIYSVPESYNVTGRITLVDGTPLDDVTIEARFASKTVRTDAQGKFSFGNIDVVTVLTPKLDGYVFTPSERSIGREAHDVQFTGVPVDSGDVIFVDPIVEAAVREALNIRSDDPITHEAALTLTSLSLWDGGVSSLDGVEHLLHLETLLIYNDNYNLHDLTPLSDLQYLREIEIDNSSIADISALAGKTHLHIVKFQNSAINDISPLATLPNLNDLSLRKSPIQDVTPLENVNELQVLSLRELDITALPSFRNMPALDWLFLQGNTSLTRIDTLIDTTATWIRLDDTAALDWCSWDDTWAIVDALRDKGKRVDANIPCNGPYALAGEVKTAVGAPYTPTIDVMLNGLSGDSWLTSTDSNGYWEHTVEGLVHVTLRVKDEESTVWRFDPPSRLHISRPYGNLDFTAYASEEPIIEGYITDDTGTPFPVEKVKLILQPDGTEIEVDVDGDGYFVYEAASHGSYNIIPVSDTEFISSVSLPAHTPSRVHLTPYDETKVPLDVHLFLTSGIGSDVVVGEERRIAVEIYDVDLDDTDITWSIDGGTMGKADFNWIEWTAPDEPGTVTVTVHVTALGRTGTDEMEITVWDPLITTIEADRYTVTPGEEVMLTATLAGYRYEDAEAMWSAEHGTIEKVNDREARWIAPNYSGTYQIRARGAVSSFRGEWTSTEIEVIPDPLCEGRENCSVIRTLEELQGMRDNVTGHYILAHDIDASPTHAWTGGFEPIGTEEEPFVGSFDGRNHTIDGLYVSRADEGVGLFGVAGEGAVISHVGITNANVIGRRAQFAVNSPPTGILLGMGRGVTVENAYSTGQVTVQRSYSSGGLIGYVRDGSTIVDSYSNATIQAEDGGGVGGLAGSLEYYSTTQDSYATGNVEGNGTLGGLIGRLSVESTVERGWSSGSVHGQGGSIGGLIGAINTLGPGGITESYSTGDVSGLGDAIGGLVGNMDGGYVKNSYSQGDVFGGGQHVGGLVGYMKDLESLIEYSWSSGDVTGSDKYVGGLVGANGGFVGGQNLGGGTIRSSHSTGRVEGAADVGGLVGRHTQGGVIEDSWASGDVEASGNIVGGLVGRARDRGPIIRDSYSTGEVRGAGIVGGFIGLNGATIERSYSEGDVYGLSSTVGGFAGRNIGRISYSGAQNNVSGMNYVGGFVGENTNDGGTVLIGEITYSYSVGDVTGVDYVGGLVGLETKNTGAIGAKTDWLAHSYAIGAVRGEQYVGGLVGRLGTDSLGSSGWVKWSYFVGTVTGHEDVGGLVGKYFGSADQVEGSYFGVFAGLDWEWDDEPHDDDAMKNPDTYVGWNFNTVWTILEGEDYPDLIDNPR